MSRLASSGLVKNGSGSKFGFLRPDGLGVAWVDGDVADGTGRLVVEDGLPGGSVVDGFPKISGPNANVNGRGVARRAGNGFDAAALLARSDAVPLEILKGRAFGETLVIIPGTKALGNGRGGARDKDAFAGVIRWNSVAG